MELQMMNGEYIPDRKGGFVRLDGAEALLQRVLFRLTARRGGFPLLPEMGSDLHLILREKPSARQAAATEYVAQALKGEDVRISKVEVAEAGGETMLTVWLEWQGELLHVTTKV